jgi:hypothetical protein
LNSQAALIRFIAIYPDSDALDNDDDNGNGSGDKSYGGDALDDKYEEDYKDSVLFVEVLLAEVPFLVFAEKYFLGSSSILPSLRILHTMQISKRRACTQINGH